ncbi:MAG: tRNA (adenosine(37)-N6)-threonylcarbamoyltransferase complex transferase subunit TsaD [Rhodocyclaceae bacterium]|nr:tRNA (adenosine(37)-N6)-threonylcarbamoyltransferase complex transferase subunit TsaD [Rhodocyclaceae bacterium]
MLVLGIETSCDETGVALYDAAQGVLGEALHSQIRLHAEYGGVVPELASRDHVRRLPALIECACERAQRRLAEIDAVAYTAGPGLAGALLAGASVASALAYALGVPALPIHHLEGHLLSPLLAPTPPAFPFVALLVSGGHTQLLRVTDVGDYECLGETLDDAAGEAFDKTAQVLGLGYPGGPALAHLAERGVPGRLKLPRPMIDSDDLMMSFSGLKTAVIVKLRAGEVDQAMRADLAAEFQEAVCDVLTVKALAACRRTQLSTLVVAGGVAANQRLRAKLTAAAEAEGVRVFFPPSSLATDNGVMIAHAAALRLCAGKAHFAAENGAFTVRPRWALDTL